MRNPLGEFKLTGLRTRLLGIVLIAVVPMAVLLVVYASIVNQGAVNEARLEAQRGLASDVRSLQDLVAGSQSTLETFGITYAVQAQNWVLAQGNADRLRSAHPSYTVIAVADSSGRVRAVSPSPGGPVNISSDPLFQRAVATKGLVVAGLGPDPVTGQPTIRVGLPVYGGTGQLIAVESISFLPKEFRDRLTASGEASVEALIDGRGTVVALQPADSQAEGKPLSSVELSRIVLANRKGETTAGISASQSQRTYFSPVFSTAQEPFYLMVSLPVEQLFGAQQRLFWLTLAGFGAVAVVALLVAWLVGTYSIYRPARLLRRAFDRLADGDLSVRAEFAAREDEFGRLKDGFNEMAQTLQVQVADLETARKELAELNSDLEGRVRRRTAELEASNRELETFSYSVSHDLRSPLRAIDGFSSALLEDYWDKLDDEGRDDLRRVRDNATRMGELIDSLLSLSRLSRQEMSLADVDLSAAASAAADQLRHLDPHRNVSFTIQPGLVARGDPALLRNVLDNLLGNAWKFTSKHESASIEFGARDIDGETAYFVKDDGAGFDMAYVGKLFGAFQRVHGQTEFPGIGIGLATTARIIRRHGGRIWAEGEPERGATFWFTLA
jgi:signal transduction histidine kinase